MGMGLENPDLPHTHTHTQDFKIEKKENNETTKANELPSDFRRLVGVGVVRVCGGGCGGGTKFGVRECVAVLQKKPCF